MTTTTTTTMIHTWHKCVFVNRFAEGKSDKEILDHLLKNTRYDKRLLPPVDGKCILFLIFMFFFFDSKELLFSLVYNEQQSKNVVSFTLYVCMCVYFSFILVLMSSLIFCFSHFR